MHRHLISAIGVLGLTAAMAAPAQSATVTTLLVCTKAGATESAAAVMSANQQTHATSTDYKWSASSVRNIRLKSTYTINKAGTYRLKGTIANGQLVINSNGNGVVRVILAGVSITSRTAAAISIQAAPKVVIVLEAGTKNTLTDGATRAVADTASGALYSRAPLTISGSGALRVTGRHGDAIAGTDGVVIAGGAITVSAKDDGIRGRDFLYVSGGTIAVTAQSDGLRSTGKKASTVGYVYIGGGRVTISAKGAAVHGISDVVIAGGSLKLTSVGNAITSSCVSFIDKAKVTISTSAKAVHSNGETVMHGGSVVIAKALEGLEGASVTVSGGTLKLTSSDDGINVTTGPATAASTATYSNSVEPSFTMSGGTALIDALGDGLDINGTGSMSGGKLVISGPTAAKDGALDLLKPFTMTGGLLIGVGASAMAMAPATSSAQASILGNLSSSQPAGSTLLIADAAGKVLAGFKATRAWQSVVLSSSGLTKGQTYKLYAGGTPSGAATGGYYTSGSLAGATLLASITAGQYTNPTPAP